MIVKKILSLDDYETAQEYIDAVRQTNQYKDYVSTKMARIESGESTAEEVKAEIEELMKHSDCYFSWESNLRDTAKFIELHCGDLMDLSAPKVLNITMNMLTWEWLEQEYPTRKVKASTVAKSEVDTDELISAAIKNVLDSGLLQTQNDWQPIAYMLIEYCGWEDSAMGIYSKLESLDFADEQMCQKPCVKSSFLKEFIYSSLKELESESTRSKTNLRKYKIARTLKDELEKCGYRMKS